MRENSANIALRIEDIKEEALADIAKRLRDAVGKAITGNKILSLDSRSIQLIIRLWTKKKR